MDCAIRIVLCQYVLVKESKGSCTHTNNVVRTLGLSKNSPRPKHGGLSNPYLIVTVFAGPRFRYSCDLISPIVRSLLKNRSARVDSCLQGLDVTEDGAVVDAAGRPSTNLFALGSVRKGLLWEGTAVPEIRIQALQLAKSLASRLARPQEKTA